MEEQKQYEKSCGAVVYCQRDDGIKYLLVCERSGYWVFPKGHMEEGESEHHTAIREIKEETGLDVTFVDGFRVQDEHNLAREGRPNTIKQNVYFLAKYEGEDFTVQESEILEIRLFDYEAAMETLQLEGFKSILTQANEFVQKRIKE